MAKDFVLFCETLWQDWLAKKLDALRFVGQHFELDAVPEPYISFGSGKKSLFILLTNPGRKMRHQESATVQSGGGPLGQVTNYAAAAIALGAFYEQELVGKPAGHRIDAMKKLSSMIGLEGVCQVEMCPFHSPSLRNKKGLLREFDKEGLLKRYMEEVEEFLISRPAVAVSAASSLNSLAPEMTLPPWAMRLSKTLGLVPKPDEFVSLVEKRGKVTAAAFVSSQNGVARALVPMMGGNRLPGESGLGILAHAFRAKGSS